MLITGVLRMILIALFIKQKDQISEPPSKMDADTDERSDKLEAVSEKIYEEDF
jgi:hypothetical protein